MGNQLALSDEEQLGPKVRHRPGDLGDGLSGPLPAGPEGGFTVAAGTFKHGEEERVHSLGWCKCMEPPPKGEGLCVPDMPGDAGRPHAVGVPRKLGQAGPVNQSLLGPPEVLMGPQSYPGDVVRPPGRPAEPKLLLLAQTSFQALCRRRSQYPCAFFLP